MTPDMESKDTEIDPRLDQRINQRLYQGTDPLIDQVIDQVIDPTIDLNLVEPNTRVGVKVSVKYDYDEEGGYFYGVLRAVEVWTDELGQLFIKVFKTKVPNTEIYKRKRKNRRYRNLLDHESSRL